MLLGTCRGDIGAHLLDRHGWPLYGWQGVHACQGARQAGGYRPAGAVGERCLR